MVTPRRSATPVDGGHNGAPPSSATPPNPAVPPVPSTTATAVSPARISPSRRGRLVGRCRRHAFFLGLAVVALIARGLVIAAYRPALMYLGDSAAYLDQAWTGLWPADWRPSGYPMFLRLVAGQAHLTCLVVIQQLLTFATGVGVYLVGLRVVRRPWAAALLALPALLAPWVLDLGQFVLADSLYGTVTLAGVLLIAAACARAGAAGGGAGGEPPRRPSPSPALAAAAGLLLGASLTIRTVGYGPLAVGAVILAVVGARSGGPRRRGGASQGGASQGEVRRGEVRQERTRRAGGRHGTVWHGAVRRGVAALVPFVLAAAAPVFAYSGWSLSEGRSFAVSAHSGFFLYGRVAPFADCSELSEPRLRTLCDPRPVAERSQPDAYLWPDDSPLRQGHHRIPRGRETLAGEFAGEVIRAQPWMMIRTTGAYLVGYFSPVRHENAKTSRADTWELPRAWTNVLPDDLPHAADGYYVTTDLDHTLAGPLAGYSDLGYAPMPLVGAGLLAGLAAVPVAWRRRRPGPPPLFWLTGGAGMSVLVLGAATAGFDYRYLASVIGLLGAAAVVGAASLVRALRPSGAGNAAPPSSPTPPAAAGAATVPAVRAGEPATADPSAARPTVDASTDRTTAATSPTSVATNATNATDATDATDAASTSEGAAGPAADASPAQAGAATAAMADSGEIAGSRVLPATPTHGGIPCP